MRLLVWCKERKNPAAFGRFGSPREIPLDSVLFWVTIRDVARLRFDCFFVTFRELCPKIDPEIGLAESDRV